jgi:uncharacterized membrane protein
MQSVRLNVHMPLYYVLLKGWMAILGESVIALRGFSVTFGVLTVIAMALFGKELYLASSEADLNPVDRRDAQANKFGLFLALIVALSPCQVFAAIEVRMYSLGTFLAAMSSWLLLRAIRAEGHWRPWATYGLTVTAVPYAHHYALFTAVAQYVFLGLYITYLAASGEWERGWVLLRRALVVAVVAVVSYLPGLDILCTQVARVRQDYWVRPLSWTIFEGTFNEFIVPRPDYDQLPHGWIAFSVFAACCLCVAWRGHRGNGLVLSLTIVPMILAAAASAITPVWVGRFFRFTQLFVLSTVALAVWRISTKSSAIRAALCAALTLGLLAANLSFWKALDLENGQGVQGAVGYIMAHRAPDEPIIALDAIQYFPAKYYVRDRAQIRMIEPGFDLFWGWHLIRPGDLITADELDDELGHGVWLIGSMPNPVITPRLGALKALEQHVFTFYNHLHAHVYVHHYRE